MKSETLDKLINKLLVLRNYHKAGLEATDKLIKELREKQEPQPTSKRSDMKDAREKKYQSYLITGKIKKNILDQALERHNVI